MSRTILVTGAGGYIGSVATYLFLRKGYTVVAVDNLTTGFKQPLETLVEKFGEERLKIYSLDMGTAEIDRVFQENPSIEAVINYAANCSVNESMQKPEKYFANNTLGTNNLLMTMMRHGVTKIIFSSTCAVYGDAHYIPLDEDHPTNPENPYGESKRLTERMMEWYSRLGKLNYVILRYFNVCGASDDSLVGDAKKPSVHLMQNAVRGALGIEPFYLTCGKFDTPDGTSIRDYVNVEDLNEAHASALEYLLNGGASEIINIGTGTGSSVLEIVKAVEAGTGAKIEVTPGEARAGESPKLVASIEKARRVLGWEPKRTIDDSVRTLVTWYKARPNGWEY
jgi:UDP-glucose 4-epimerase